MGDDGERDREGRVDFLSEVVVVGERDKEGRKEGLPWLEELGLVLISTSVELQLEVLLASSDASHN